LESDVHGIDWQTRLRGNPAGLNAKTRRLSQAQNCFSALLRGSVGDDGRIKAQMWAKVTDHSRREAAAAAENLRKRGMVGTEISSKCAKGITRIPFGATAKF
jgi:hypothetical protein